MVPVFSLSKHVLYFLPCTVEAARWTIVPERGLRGLERLLGALESISEFKSEKIPGGKFLKTIRKFFTFYNERSK
jgi:hypothetical protein